MNPFLTSKENIVINLLFEWLNESRYNRSLKDYIVIALRVPKTLAVHAYVNQRLSEMAKAGHAPYQICYFKPHDRYPWFEDFPKSLSIETVRSALNKFGMSKLRELANDTNQNATCISPLNILASHASH
jgi:hypothetical protein